VPPLSFANIFLKLTVKFVKLEKRVAPPFPDPESAPGLSAFVQEKIGSLFRHELLSNNTRGPLVIYNCVLYNCLYRKILFCRPTLLGMVAICIPSTPSQLSSTSSCNGLSVPDVALTFGRISKGLQGRLIETPVSQTQMIGAGFF
jgi:hypothetical protein